LRTPQQVLDVTLHAAHLRFHLVVHSLPLVDLPLELLDLRAGLVPARGRALAVALAALLLPPLSKLLVAHGGDGGGSVVVLGLVEERRFFLRWLGFLYIFANLPLFCENIFLCVGGHDVRYFSRTGSERARGRGCACFSDRSLSMFSVM